jgi:GT2 family glycosyltransferase
VISVVAALADPAPTDLQRCVDSVLAQEGADWELCLVHDGPPRPSVRSVLDRCAAADPRVRVHHRVEHGGRAAAANDGIAMAVGDYVAFVDVDGVLAPGALLEAAQVIEANPDVDLLYTDEAGTSGDDLTRATFYKPSWSPEYLRGCMYLGHLCIYRRAALEEVGGLRSELEGAHEWDLALRVTERTNRVVHVPGVRYCSRQPAATPGAGWTRVPGALNNARRAIDDHLARTGVAGHGEPTEVDGWFRVRREILGDPMISVIVPTAGWKRIVRDQMTDLVINCLTSVLSRTRYDHFEVLCVVEQGDDETASRVLRLGDDRVRVVTAAPPFNFSARVNTGVAHATGSHVVLLNDDTEVLADDWMTLMLEQSQQPDVGAVGAKLRYEDGRIQHAGVVAIDGRPTHVLRSCDGRGYFGNLHLNREYAAVTGACMMTRRDVFEEVGGFNPRLTPNYDDIDYCYKVFTRGYRIVMAMAAELYHFESSTRGDVAGSVAELEGFLDLWGGDFVPDPYYNPQFKTPNCEV